MLKDKVIVCISPIEWDFLWQRHQIIMQSLAQSGNRVFYIENLSPSLSLNFSIFSKILKRMKKVLFGSSFKDSKQIPNLKVITPFVLPFKNRLAEFINKKLFIKLLCLLLKSRGIEKPIIWTYLVTSEALELIAHMEPQFLVYDCVFDIITHPDYPKETASFEKIIMESADLIFTDNLLLLKKCKQANPATYLIQPGVDFELFSSAKYIPELRLFKKIGKPRICFFGGIDEIRIDLGLIKFIAKNRPEWNIILFGPVIKTNVSTLKIKNIFFMGTLKHEELPWYLKEIDVLILPYKIIPFSNSIFPAKIFECLATGKPIVSTPLSELSFYPEEIIRFASRKEDFISAIEKSLNSTNPNEIRKRIVLAQENSWAKRLTDIQTIIEEALNNKRKTE